MKEKQGSSYRGGSGSRTAYLGLFLALAILFGYVESLIPQPLPVPGMKLGLANLVIAAILYLYSWREALLISAVRVVLLGFLFGNLFSIAYGLSGAAASLLVMALLKASGRFSIVGVSCGGGAAHTAAQTLLAALIVSGFPWRWYLPILMLSGLAAGFLVGIADAVIIPRIRTRGIRESC
ncbi:MAG: Gx transporter family protein [Lachnospiraceae bacterium]|nr:Gx transporter family protein [Lachnospiraceae bacterium]